MNKLRTTTFCFAFLAATLLLPDAAFCRAPDYPVPARPQLVSQPWLAQEPPQNQQDEAKTFTGKISKANGKYVLEEASMNTTYNLDDQKTAQKYEGKSVLVTGVLDPASNTIHVKKIESAA